jgi:hypothetical protein
MISDRLARSARHATSGEALTLLLIAVSILGGIALAIACSYRPIALWWVMVAASTINVIRFIARQSLKSRAERPALPPLYVRLAALATRAFAWARSTFGRATIGTSKASLDRQHTRFLVWFAEHNLLWTTIGFGVSLLLWYRFGPTKPALVVMAALMSCGLFAALGAAAGASSPMLGLCWREPCRTPDFRSLRRIVHDIGCVVVLANRRDYAASCDWAKGGRFHELFLTVNDLARAGVEPGLEAVLAADDGAARRALARKERLDRALALAPIFAAGVLAALLAVPPLAGSEPLPSLWTIFNRTANPRGSINADDNSRDLPSAGSPSAGRREEQKRASEGSRAPSSQRADGDRASSASQSGRERPDLSGQSGGSSITGDAVATAPGDGTGAAGQGPQAGDGTGGESGSAGSGGASRDGRSDGSSGRGGGPRGYGTGGVAPQRAESPSALPDAAVNPGKAIEVVLPAFSEVRDGAPGDDPTGTKRKANAPDLARASQAPHQRTTAPNEPATREPVQRWPNWVFQLLHK